MKRLEVKLDGRGFTLMEIVIVLAILTLMLGIALPNLLAYYRNGQELERQQQQELVDKTLRQYYAFQGVFPHLDDSDSTPQNGNLTQTKLATLRDKLYTVTAVTIDINKYNTSGYNYAYDETNGTVTITPIV